MRAIYAPSTLFIKDISERLKALEIPIYFELPEPEVLEPFIVIGGYTTTSGRTAKTNNLIEDMTLNVDIFLPKNSRTEAEEVRFKAIKLIGRREGMDSTLLIDDSIGRETYHIPFRISQILT